MREAMACKILFLITTPKMGEKAQRIFAEEQIPVKYNLHASGTATSDIMDTLGLGSTDKSILLCALPQSAVEKIMRRLSRELRIGTVNSGIAFTLPLTGTNMLMLRMLEQIEDTLEQAGDRKEGTIMSEPKYALIAAVVNRGFSTEVMDAARAAGASGGSVLHTRQIAGEEASSKFGLSLQEEKDIILIVSHNQGKAAIMKQIGEKCGARSPAKGIVFSLPIDDAIGLER